MGTPKPPGSADQTLDLAEQLQAAKAELTALGDKRREMRMHLTELRFVNDGLCKRLGTYRRDCPISARLFPTGLEKTLECEGNVEERVKTAPEIEVAVETISGQGSFSLKAGATHESATFGSGSTPALRWTAEGAASTLPPRLWELTSLRLKSSTGAISVDDFSKFEIRLNGRVLLSKSDLVALPDSTSMLDVRLDGVLAQKKTVECIIEDEELDRITQEGKANAAAAFAEDEPLSLTESGDEEGILAELDASKEAIQKFKKDLGQTSIQAGREEDRNGKLSKELTSDRAAGCFARQKLESLEVQFTGAHLPLMKLAPSKEQRAEIDNPRKFTFRFGNQFAHTHADEEQQSLLVEGGRLLLTDLGDRTIGDLEYMSIEKGGIGLDSVENCWRVFLRQHCEWVNSEKNIYRMDGFVVKVNGEEFYRASGLNHTFREGALLWQDKNIGMNQSYRALMRRTDCPAK